MNKYNSACLLLLLISGSSFAQSTNTLTNQANTKINDTTIKQLTKNITTAADNYTNDKASRTVAESKIYIKKHDQETLAMADNYTNNKASTTVAKSKIYIANQEKSTLKQANSYTDKQLKLTSTENHQDIAQLNQRVDQLTYNIQKVHDDANAGTASAMAMAAIPMRQGYNYTIGLGTANYGNQSAIALGGKFNVGQNSIITIAASDDTEHHSGVAAGIGFGF